MAFKIFANALLVETDFNPVKRGFSKFANISQNSSFDIKSFSPRQYLFSHCTIIASVDTDQDCSHHITANTEKYINQNYDSWTRGVLKNSYRTFVGAPNYVEHVQVPELSKGTIVDAVLRDIDGETLYCDILVATDRKHEELVSRIKTGSMKAMSMGCIASYTFCTQCGNQAFNESQLCSKVKFQKGAKFFTKKGEMKTIAELCGHDSDPSSVRFIEASWVEVPAFTGAVLRNVVNLDKSIQIKTSHTLSSLIGSSFHKSASGPNPFFTDENNEDQGDSAEDSGLAMDPADEEESNMKDSLSALFSTEDEDEDEEDTDKESNAKNIIDSTSTNENIIEA